jgi:hypothetical protein
MCIVALEYGCDIEDEALTNTLDNRWLGKYKIFVKVVIGLYN